MFKKIFLDTNLLLLLVVGATGIHIIKKHRRLQEFDKDDYKILTDILDGLDLILVTPNTLTETSNLLAYHKDPEKTQLFNTLRVLIEESEEIIVTSKTASHNRYFEKFGITDAAILEVISSSTPLLTDDFNLYQSAISKDKDSAFNFRHFQSLD